MLSEARQQERTMDRCTKGNEQKRVSRWQSLQRVCSFNVEYRPGLSFHGLLQDLSDVEYGIFIKWHILSFKGQFDISVMKEL